MFQDSFRRVVAGIERLTYVNPFKLLKLVEACRMHATGSAMDQLGRDNRFENDLRLGPEPFDEKLVRDRGRRIPNFNDDFRGAAPDIGADELP